MSFTSWLRIVRSAMAFVPALRAHRRQRPLQPRTHRLGLEVLEDRSLPSTFTVLNLNDSGPDSLRAAVVAANASPGADTIDFATTGTISLTSGELDITDGLTINGPGAGALTVSGNHASRVFDVSAGVTVTIAGMTMTDGMADGSSPVLACVGGGILNRGNLTLTGDVLSDNEAVGDPAKLAFGKPGSGFGGGLANVGAGTLAVSGCAFLSNLSLGVDGSSGNGAGSAHGGAIANMDSATAGIADSSFVNNVVRAGSHESGPIAATGAGGAIINTSAVTVTGSTFSHNQAIGGNDSSGPSRPGLGVGGAIVSGASLGPAAHLVISGSTFDHNQAIGGNANTGTESALTGPNDAFGGGLHVSGGIAAVSGCTFEHNAAIAGAGADGRRGGLAEGGGADAANFFAPRIVDATFSDCTFTHNMAIGGSGGPGGNGGDGWGGGLADLLGASLTLSNCTVAHNLAIGGAGGLGGNGGNGLGGGIFQDALSTLTLHGASVDHNHAIGGEAGLGGSDGEGVGGGLYITPGGVAYADALTTIFGNHATTGDDDVFGILL
jgi:hypothetical protein